MSDIRCLNDDELKEVSGGKSTGDVDAAGNVYIVFPFPFMSMSNYYGVNDVEDLAAQYYDQKDLIKPFIDTKKKNAIIDLYNRQGATMSPIVREFLDL